MRRLRIVIWGMRRRGIDQGEQELGLLAEEGGLVESVAVVVQEREVED